MNVSKSSYLNFSMYMISKKYNLMIVPGQCSFYWSNSFNFFSCTIRRTHLTTGSRRRIYLTFWQKRSRISSTFRSLTSSTFWSRIYHHFPNLGMLGLIGQRWCESHSGSCGYMRFKNRLTNSFWDCEIYLIWSSVAKID